MKSSLPKGRVDAPAWWSVAAAKTWKPPDTSAGPPSANRPAVMNNSGCRTAGRCRGGWSTAAEAHKSVQFGFKYACKPFVSKHPSVSLQLHQFPGMQLPRLSDGPSGSPEVVLTSPAEKPNLLISFRRLAWPSSGRPSGTSWSYDYRKPDWRVFICT